MQVVAVFLVVVALVAVIAHFRAPGDVITLAVSAGAPYLMAGGFVGAFALLLGRHWWAAALAVVVLAAGVLTQAPLFVASTAPRDNRAIVVMTANLLFGHAEPDAVVAAVRRHAVDVLMLQELTPQEQDALQRAGLDRLLPHHVSDPRPTARGTGLWSRYPLTATTRRTDFSYALVTARITVPSAPRRVQLAAVHLAGPVSDTAPWQNDIAHLRRLLPSLASAGPTIVAGDFNATPDVAQFRHLLSDGYHDGARQAGAGLVRTYPSNTWFPPLLGLDHVLTRNAVATQAATIEIAGSDHRTLIVRVTLGRA